MTWAKFPSLTSESFCFDDPGSFADHFVHDVCRVFSTKPGDLVMDIGANKGLVTLVCALLGARVVAYEPSPVAFEILQDTIQRNNIQNSVEALNVAIHTSVGRIPMLYNDILPDPEKKRGKVVNGNTIGPFTAEHGLSCEVDAITLKDAVGDRTWDCIKMDVEGAEFDLLLSCPEGLFRQIRRLSVELHSHRASQQTENRLLQRLRDNFPIIDVAKEPSGRLCGIFART